MISRDFRRVNLSKMDMSAMDIDKALYSTYFQTCKQAIKAKSPCPSQSPKPSPPLNPNPHNNPGHLGRRILGLQQPSLPAHSPKTPYSDPSSQSGVIRNRNGLIPAPRLEVIIQRLGKRRDPRLGSAVRIHPPAALSVVDPTRADMLVHTACPGIPSASERSILVAVFGKKPEKCFIMPRTPSVLTWNMRSASSMSIFSGDFSGERTPAREKAMWRWNLSRGKRDAVSAEAVLSEVDEVTSRGRTCRREEGSVLEEEEDWGREERMRDLASEGGRVRVVARIGRVVVWRRWRVRARECRGSRGLGGSRAWTFWYLRWRCKRLDLLPW